VIVAVAALRYNRGVELLITTAVLIWSFKAGAPADAPPLVAENRVYYAAGDKKLYALRLEDGSELWSRRFKAPLPEAPVSAGDYVYLYVPHPEGRIYALRAADGKNVWRGRAGPGVVKAAVGERAVAVGHGEAVVFYDRLSGAEEGKVRFDENVVGAAYAGDGTFLAWTGGGYVAACRPRDAEPLWRTRAVVGGVYVAAASGRAYVAGASGEMASYDLLTGDEIWRTELGEPLTGAPVASGDEIFVPGRRTVFTCDALTGEILWAFEPGGNVVGAAVHRGRAVVACEDGRVYAATAEGSEEIFKLESYAATAPAAAADLILATDGEKRLLCFKFE
jgi:outer membrane protein assembly factor BamB